MQSHGALEILGHQMLQWTDFDGAGIVDQDIDLTKPIDRLTNSRLNLFGIEQIAWNCHYCAVTPSEVALGTRQFLSAACNQANIPTSRANLPRNHQSQPTRSPRHED